MDTEQKTGATELVAAANVARDVCLLPAVPTLDWCDRAAACLTGVAPPCYAVVLIGTVDPMGQIRIIEGAGVGATLRTEITPRLATSERMSTLRPDDSMLAMLRARLFRASSLGFVPGEEGLSGLVCDRASTLHRQYDWRTGPMGRLWSGYQIGEPLVALMPLGGVEHGRVLAAMVAPALPDAGASEGALLVLRAVLPLLTRRAVEAVGPTRSNPRMWVTVREQEVLEQLTLGRSVKEIAETLGRSPHTVHDHVKSLHKKLNASTRGELVARALGHAIETARVGGLFTPPPQALGA